MHLHRLVALSLVWLLSACGGGSRAANRGAPGELDDEAAAEATVERLARMLAGTFDSAEQAARDDGYVAVQLSACPVAVPALGRPVLYVEQALLSSPASPYRQRFYALSATSADDAVSVVYEPRDARVLVGLCDDSEEERAERAPGADAIDKLEGCEVLLTRTDDGFTGGTREGACPTDFNGASTVQSDVTVLADRLLTWDRGFDDAGEQVWGAVDGPYEFMRRD